MAPRRRLDRRRRRAHADPPLDGRRLRREPQPRRSRCRPRDRRRPPPGPHRPPRRGPRPLAAWTPVRAPRERPCLLLLTGRPGASWPGSSASSSASALPSSRCGGNCRRGPAASGRLPSPASGGRRRPSSGIPSSLNADLLGEGPRLRPPRLPRAPSAPPEELARPARAAPAPRARPCASRLEAAGGFPPVGRSAASPAAWSFAPTGAASPAAAPERRPASAIASSIAAERSRQLANSPVLIRLPAAPSFCSRVSIDADAIRAWAASTGSRAPDSPASVGPSPPSPPPGRRLLLDAFVVGMLVQVLQHRRHDLRPGGVHLHRDPPAARRLVDLPERELVEGSPPRGGSG